MNPELLRTCIFGDVEKLRKLIEPRSHDHEFFLFQENEEKKNILHILFSPGKQACAEEALSRLQIQVVRRLVCQPDIHGDNPLHLAASCGFLGVVKLLVDACKDLPSPPWIAKNKRGKLPVQVAVDRCHDEVAEFLLSVDRDFLYNVENAGSLLDDAVTNSCERTGVRLLERHPEEVFKRRQSSDKMEILELAIEKDVVDIIKMILNIDTTISYDLQNEDGENPLHIAVERGRLKIAQILVDAFNDYRQVEGDKEAAAHLLSLQPPWRQMDKKERTPLHRALVDGYLDLAKVMLSSDFAFLSCLADHSHEQDSPNSLAKELEDSKEFRDVYLDTFLQFVRDNRGEATKMLIEQHPELVRFKNNYGRTILQHASNQNDVDTMIFILRAAVNIPYYELVPLLIESDDVGKLQTTALHNVRLQSHEKYRELLAIPAIALLKNKTDASGSTPLIKAIQNSEFHLADTLLDIEGVDVMSIKRQDGKTAAALLKDKSKESIQWAELYKKAARLQPLGTDVRDTHILIRNDMQAELYKKGARLQPLGTDVRDIRNTLFVVAALLATITFAAAFTVPGGFDQNSGDVILGRKPAFIIFILWDTYAMCCSMLVLYALIWVASQEPDQALKLINFSVKVLYHSFYGTLGAFMTGVYTILSSKWIWVAIIVLVMCSTIMIFAYMTITFKLGGLFIDACLSTEANKEAESPV